MSALLPCFCATELHTSINRFGEDSEQGELEKTTPLCVRDRVVCVYICVCVCVCVCVYTCPCYLPDPGVFAGYGGVTYFNCLA